MTRWFRIYDEILDDPKVQLLSPELFRAWINILAIASKSGGNLPPVRDMAFALRLSVDDIQSKIEDLILAGLIDVLPGKKLAPHNWSRRQWKSDDSADRVRKHRAKKTQQPETNGETDTETACNDAVTVAVTPPDTETETDTENKFLPSEQGAPRAKVNELRFGLGLKNGRAGRVDLDYLARRAEGLGLDASDLIGTTNRAAPKKPTAYMTTLCVNRLKERLPGIDENVIRDALWGKDKQFAVLCQLLLDHAP